MATRNSSRSPISYDAAKALLSFFKETDIPQHRPKYAGQLTREDVKAIVSSLPAKDLHVLQRGRKAGPPPGALFYDKWQEKQKLAAEQNPL